MSDASMLLKLGAIACLALASGALVGLVAATRDGALHRAYFRYVAQLERRLRLLFIELRVRYILMGQAIALLLVLGLGAFASPMCWLLVPVVMYGPLWLLERRRRQRMARIEQNLDGFVLALANALRASPSAARALAMIQPVTAAPLNQEVELVLREMHVGSTLEQALANLSARVQSFQLDAAMTGLLIGRQTGGDVPAILDGAAHTLREMTRLRGVLRAKTAEGRAQANVLAVFPLGLILVFDFASPGYFRPLTESLTGVVVMTLALLMWGSSIFMTRRIMAVEL
jgi:tight adherence protein B